MKKFLHGGQRPFTKAHLSNTTCSGELKYHVIMCHIQIHQICHLNWLYMVGLKVIKTCLWGFNKVRLKPEYSATEIC